MGIKEGFTKELTFELGLEELNFDKGRKEAFQTKRTFTGVPIWKSLICWDLTE